MKPLSCPVHGIGEPVTLELSGNARLDLAGCVVKFQRPRSRTLPVERDVAELLDSPQRGTAGRITAAERSGADRSGGASLAPMLRMEWLNIGFLIRCTVEVDDCCAARPSIP